MRVSSVHFLRIGAFAAALSMIASEARADQCSLVPAAQANAAVLHLRSGRPFIELCEPCGQHFDPSSSNVQRVVSAIAVPDSSGLHHVIVNGRPVDLAYLFVRGRGGFQNVARLSGCEASGVSEQLLVPSQGGALGGQVTGQFAAPPPVIVPTYGQPVVSPPMVAPPPVVAPPPSGFVYRYAGRVVSSSGTAPTLPGAACVVQVRQVTNSQQNNCRVEVSCGGQTLYGRGNSGYGVCAFNSVRTGLLFRRNSTTITMNDARISPQDGDPAISLNLPRGGIIVRDAMSPVNSWVVSISGIRPL